MKHPVVTRHLSEFVEYGEFVEVDEDVPSGAVWDRATEWARVDRESCVVTWAGHRWMVLVDGGPLVKIYEAVDPGGCAPPVMASRPAPRPFGQVGAGHVPQAMPDDLYTGPIPEPRPVPVFVHIDGTLIVDHAATKDEAQEMANDRRRPFAWGFADHGGYGVCYPERPDTNMCYRGEEDIETPEQTARRTAIATAEVLGITDGPTMAALHGMLKAGAEIIRYIDGRLYAIGDTLGWSIFEAMGNRRIAGRVSRTLGGNYLVEIPIGPEAQPGGQKWMAQVYGEGALYCLTPCSEERAREELEGPLHNLVAERVRPAAPSSYQRRTERRDDDDEEIPF